MFYKDINARFTAKVTELISKGYYINTSTMSGSQGEISKVDLTDGKEIIRVLLDRTTEYSNETYEALEALTITVGRVPENAEIAPNTTGWRTIWNDHLEVISSETYYQIGAASSIGNAYYGTLEEASEAREKQRARYKAQFVSDYRDLPESAKAIVLPYVRRQPKCSRKKISDIKSVYHYKNGYKIETDRMSYVLR